MLEEKLSSGLKVNIRIRPKSYIVAHINNSRGTMAAFQSYLNSAVDYLRQMGTANPTASFTFKDTVLCTFLSQEVARRRGKQKLMVTLVDTLILWSLETSDPDKRLFLTKKEILARVLEAIPTAKVFINGVIDQRLRILSSKGNEAGRQISH